MHTSECTVCRLYVRVFKVNIQCENKQQKKEHKQVIKTLEDTGLEWPKRKNAGKQDGNGS